MPFAKVHIMCIIGGMKGGANMGTFGQRLKQLRNERGISQNELSKHIGVSKSSVNMYERDEREPGFETLEAIADFFNVDMDYLLGREPKESFASEFPEIESVLKNLTPTQFSIAARPTLLKILASMANFGSPDAKENFAEICTEVYTNFTLSDMERLEAFTKAFTAALKKDMQLIEDSQPAPAPQEGTDPPPPDRKSVV